MKHNGTAAFLTGLGLGAGAMFILNPKSGGGRLSRGQRLSNPWRRSGEAGAPSEEERDATHLIPADTTTVARVAAGAGGAALIGAAAMTRTPLGAALGAVGLGLIAQAAFNRRLRLFGGDEASAVVVRKSFTVAVPPAEVYAFWLNLENFPRFFSHLSEVRSLGGDRFHFVARGPAGVEQSWDAAIVKREPNRFISWRSEEGSQLINRGVVRFEPVSGGTRVQVWITYTPPGGALGHLVASLFGDDPRSAIEEDLQRVTRVIEDTSHRAWAPAQAEPFSGGPTPPEPAL